MGKLVSSKSRIKINTPDNIVRKWKALYSDYEYDVDDNTIVLFDIIDGWGSCSAESVRRCLKRVGDNPVSVLINSPGGDLVEGIAIYNLLKSHNQTVNVKVLSLAASASAMIAMAGDNIELMQGAHIMIHNAWGAVVGNSEDLTKAADLLKKYDGEMKSIFALRTGQTPEALEEMMNEETYLGESEAVELGFADKVGELPKKKDQASAQSIESLLNDMDRKELIKRLMGKSPVVPDETKALVNNLTSIFKEN